MKKSSDGIFSMAQEDQNRRIGEKFIEIESKLRSSFQAIREDMDSIKQKLDSRPTGTSETKAEVQFLREKLAARFSDLDKDIQTLKSQRAKTDDSALRELASQISSLKSSIVSKEELESLKDGLKNELTSLKKQITKTGVKEEVSKELNDRLSLNLDIIAQKLKDSKNSLETETTKAIKDLQKQQEGLIFGFEKEVKHIKDRTEKEKQDLLEEFQSEVSKLRKEVSSTKNDFSKNLEERDEKIITLQKQISYLKGQLKSKQTISEQLTEEVKEPIKEEKIKEPFKMPFKISFNPLALKILIGLVILALLVSGGFMLYSNLSKSQEISYFYDIGGLNDSNNSYLSPSLRISGVLNDSENTTYRALLSDLVYFNVSVPNKSTSIDVQVRYKSNLFNVIPINIAAENDIGWNYTYKTLDSLPLNNRWTIKSLSFDVKDLYIENNTLNMFFNTGSLGNISNVKVDWINITIHKN